MCVRVCVCVRVCADTEDFLDELGDMYECVFTSLSPYLPQLTSLELTKMQQWEGEEVNDTHTHTQLHEGVHWKDVGT